MTLAEAGGAQTYVRTLIPFLVERFDLTVAAHGPGPVREAAAAAGVPFVSLRYVRRRLDPLGDALGLIELVRLFRRVRPDIVHLNSSKMGFLGRLAAALAGVPIRVLTAHGWAFAWHTGVASRMYRLADRLMAPLTTCVIAVSHQQRAAGLRAGTCRAGRTVVIHNAVEPGPAPRRPASGGPVRLVSVGRPSPPKDVVTLVRALALVPSGSVRVRLVGDGRERPALEAEAARLGVDGALEFLGERRDVPALLADADVFVLSSRSEGMPVSVLEAMAAGLPVVASAVGGVPEVVVSGETGVLVPPGDPPALAEALARLAADPDLRLRFGRAGRTRAEEHFGLPAFRRAHLELYQRELRARGLPAPTPSGAKGSRGARRGEPGTEHESRHGAEQPLRRVADEQQAGVRGAEVSV